MLISKDHKTINEYEAIVERKAKHDTKAVFKHVQPTAVITWNYFATSIYNYINGYYLFPLNSFNPDIIIIFCACVPTTCTIITGTAAINTIAAKLEATTTKYSPLLSALR